GVGWTLIGNLQISANPQVMGTTLYLLSYKAKINFLLAPLILIDALPTELHVLNPSDRVA
ncbi:Hypothetical predicted protein, partial [Paramuricea clavata]